MAGAARLTTTRFKILGAIVLAGSLALPVSTCTGYRSPDGKFVTWIPTGADSAAYPRAVDRDYVLHDVYLVRPSTWFNLAVFVWPLPVVALTQRRRTARWRRWVWWLEPLLVAISGWTVWLVANLLATPAIGAYVALGALGVYLSAWAVELWREVIRGGAMP